MKAPPKSSYGTDDDIFCNTCIGDGYIPRNLRLIYSFIDLVSPYVVFDKPAILENRVILTWKLNGCLQIDKMEIGLKNSTSGFYQ